MKTIYSLLLVLIPSILCGQVVLWNFDGATTAPASVVPNVTAANVQTGSGVTDPGNPFPGGNPGDAYAQQDWSTSGFDPDDYFEFTVTPNSGHKMNLSAFEFDEMAQVAGSADIELRSNIDGFASPIATGSVNSTWTTHTFSLGSAFQDLTSSITFRLYGYNFNTQSEDWLIDNVNIQGAVVLPITLSAFEGKYHDGTVALTWETAVEINNDFFVIQRRENHAFEDIGVVQGMGNANTKQTYAFVDELPLNAPISYYRLKQVDFDGQETLHRVIKVITVKTQSTILFKDLPQEIDGVFLNMIGEEIEPHQNLPGGIYFWEQSGEVIRVWK